MSGNTLRIKDFSSERIQKILSFWTISFFRWDSVNKMCFRSELWRIPPFSGPCLQSLRQTSFLFSGFAFFEAESSLWVMNRAVVSMYVARLPPEGASACISILAQVVLSIFPFQESSSSADLLSHFLPPLCPVPSLFFLPFVCALSVSHMSCRISSFFGKHEESKFSPAVNLQIFPLFPTAENFSSF